jgi:Sulfotransferase family
MVRTTSDGAAGSTRSDGPIYIAGLDRSGKTTLRAYLTSHPDIDIPAVGSNMETYFYGRYGNLAKQANLDRCLEDMLRYKHIVFLDPDEDRIRSEFAAGPPTYPHLFSLFLRHHAEKAGKRRWGAQTGLAEEYADVLFASYPGLKVIHMVRDPRDRYQASRAKWPNGKGGAGGAAARWALSTGLARRNLRRHPNDYLVVRFEDLIRSTHQTLAEVFDFLGEDLTPEALEMKDAPKHRFELLAGRAPNEPLLSTAFIGLHRELPQRELSYLELVLAGGMRRHGYERTAAPPRRPGFWLGTVPDQMARQLAWRATEAAHLAQPRLFPRTPGARMIVPRHRSETV